MGGPRLNHQAGRYAHANQYKRMRRVIKRKGAIGGRRLLRDIDRKTAPPQMTQLTKTIHGANA